MEEIQGDMSITENIDTVNDVSACGDANKCDRREYPRSEFTYPVEFRVFSRSSDSPSFQNTNQTNFNGYLKDISLSGARLQFEDRYGRFDINGMQHMRLKLTFKIPGGGRTSVFAEIKWIRKTDPKDFSIEMGIAFKEMEAWQSDAIGKLIGMRNKDHNMMWNLWEQHQDNGR